MPYLSLFVLLTFGRENRIFNSLGRDSRGGRGGGIRNAVEHVTMYITSEKYAQTSESIWHTSTRRNVSRRPFDCISRTIISWRFARKSPRESFVRPRVGCNRLTSFEPATTSTVNHHNFAVYVTFSGTYYMRSGYVGKHAHAKYSNEIYCCYYTQHCSIRIIYKYVCVRVWDIIAGGIVRCVDFSRVCRVRVVRVV